MPDTSSPRAILPLALAFALGTAFGSVATAAWPWVASRWAPRYETDVAGPPRVALRGTVTLNGSPLAEGSIRFALPDPRNPVDCAAVIRDGRYEIPADQGVPPGRYRVEITNVPPGPTGGPLPPPLPARYHAQSQLHVELSAGGPNVFDFALESSDRKK
jgi:hypothetical protein